MVKVRCNFLIVFDFALHLNEGAFTEERESPVWYSVRCRVYYVSTESCDSIRFSHFLYRLGQNSLYCAFPQTVLVFLNIAELPGMGIYFLSYEWILNKITLEGERYAIREKFEIHASSIKR